MKILPGTASLAQMLPALAHISLHHLEGPGFLKRIRPGSKARKNKMALSYAHRKLHAWEPPGRHEIGKFSIRNLAALLKVQPHS